MLIITDEIITSQPYILIAWVITNKNITVGALGSKGQGIHSQVKLYAP